MINKHILLNNKLPTNNCQLLKDLKIGSRALVLSTGGAIKKVPAGVRLADFFDVIIAEDFVSHQMTGFSDFVFYSDPSAYTDGIFNLDKYKDLKESIIIMNYGAIKDLVKLKKDVGIYNLSYIPTDCVITGSGGGPMNNELNVTCSGVHLSKILGCTTIFCDKETAHSTFMGTEDLHKFVTEKNMVRPKNLLNVSRNTILKATF